ncbi:MAG: hypothetical protein OIF54_15770, partial [Cohaesibacter sp.]|nr:hypothetical protein [Cohaesibacter sp.]
HAKTQTQSFSILEGCHAATSQRRQNSKSPGAGKACRAKAQTDQGVSKSWAGQKIPHPKTSCQNLKQRTTCH